MILALQPMNIVFSNGSRRNPAKWSFRTFCLLVARIDIASIEGSLAI